MLGKILAVALGVAGLIAGSQAPNFTNNFLQNLEGRVSERLLDYQRITERWADYGLSRDQVAEDCEAGTMPESNPRASCLEDELIVTRYELLADLQTELKSASKWERPILLGKAVLEGSCASEADEDLASRKENELDTLCVRYLALNTLEEYKVAVPVTPEGAVYGLGGGASFWAVFRILFGLIGLPFRPRYA